MALIPLYEAKTYLRVDSSDEDALIGILLSSAEQMCKDVGRLSEDQWEAVNAADRDAENGVQPTRELELSLIHILQGGSLEPRATIKSQS